MLTIHSEQALPGEYPEGYEDMTYDGCWFYIIVACKQKILKLDQEFHVVDCIDTVRAYSCICYDPFTNCFWAAGESCGANLFRLNEHLVEIGCMKFGTGNKQGVKIRSISCCCISNQLLIAMDNELIMVDKTHPLNPLMVKCYTDASLQGALCIYPYIISYYIKGNRQYLGVLSIYGGVKQEYEVPAGLRMCSILLFPCVKEDDDIHFKALVRYGKCQFGMIEFVISRCVLECLHQCNYIICQKDCTSQNGCNAVLESIALMEVSIAHILNAEGEKIQKAVAESSCISQLLEVNESVRETIVSATHLEQVLFEKLHALCNCEHLCDHP
ncbi:MAG: hypothetical protein RR446_01045 [Lachnospiraceae bacterium]